MYVVTAPWWLRKIYSPHLIWSFETRKKEIFLTFDDGPHPTITPFVLDCLERYNAKATFFCIGKNVQQHPEIFQEIIDKGHAIGNHTDNHLNGWETGDEPYIKDVMAAHKKINSSLFRPPYGRITKSQVKQLLPRFKIIMWNVLSADFDVELTPQACFDNVIFNASPGSIIVFHDSDKAFFRLEYTLPKVLQFFTEKGYRLQAIL